MFGVHHHQPALLQPDWTKDGKVSDFMGHLM